MSDIRLAHIINPIGFDATHPFFPIQEITFESILNARKFSANRQIELLTAQFPEDRKVIPDGFTVLPDLKQSLHDELKNENVKKLPFIDDILKAAYQHSSADYIIYTNMDIGLMPYFYEFVLDQIEQHQYDVMLITRRRLGLQYKSKKQLSEIYADKGKPHPGYDTFVIHRSLIPKLILDKICVGVAFLEVSLLHNFVAFAQNMKIFDLEHLTFHIGMEVMPPLHKTLYQYNRNIYEKNVLPELKKHLHHAKFPYADNHLIGRLLTWGLNPSYRTALMLEMEGMNMKRKLKFLSDELRWRLLQGN